MSDQILSEIPYGCYWSTPFFKWQGKVQNLHSLRFAAWVTQRELERRELRVDQFDLGILGHSVPQQNGFYGMPWLASMAGGESLTGPIIAQACATGTRCLQTAAGEIALQRARSVLIVGADRTSNSPHLYYPNPAAPGGTGAHEDWVMDSFNCDPAGGHAMVNTAENVATKHKISTGEQHEVVLRRQEQYQEALADDCAFQRRYMTLPFEVPDPRFRKIAAVAQSDEGVAPCSEEGLASLRPVLKDGTVTFGGQTHPADGNAGLVVTNSERARELSSDPSIAIRVLGFGQARCQMAHMPEATIPASEAALASAGVAVNELAAIKTHNPFAVNDIILAREMKLDLDAMNNFGCSLIYGHPQGVTSLRSMIELIEELVAKGGGTGLFVGCSAGDSSMAAVLQVTDRSA